MESDNGAIRTRHLRLLRAHRRDAAAASGPSCPRSGRHHAAGQGRVGESRRQREGPRRRIDGAGCAGPRPAHARQDRARRQQRQHRHCLCHAGRGARLPRPSCYARQRLSGAQADSARLRSLGGVDRSGQGLGRRDSARPRTGRQRPGLLLLHGPVLERRQLAGALPHHRPGDLAADRGTSDSLCRRARHHAAPLWEWRAGSRSSIPRFRPSAFSPTRRSTAWKGSSTWAPRWFRPSTTPAWPIASWKWRPRPPTTWRDGWRGTRVCWWASPRLPPFTRACRLRAKRRRRDASAVDCYRASRLGRQVSLRAILGGRMSCLRLTRADLRSDPRPRGGDLSPRVLRCSAGALRRADSARNEPGGWVVEDASAPATRALTPRIIATRLLPSSW